MDYLAPIQHQDVALSRNPIVVAVDPVVLGPGDPRIDLHYYCEVFVQDNFQSGTFQSLSIQEASEEPPLTDDDLSIGAYFDIQTRLDDLLRVEPPPFVARQVQVCADMARQYYYTTSRYNADELLDTDIHTSGWVIKSGIAERDYDAYAEQFFTSHIGAGRRFLTWQPDNKFVRADQPEWLYFLTNFSPLPTQLLVRVDCLYSDNTRETYTALTIADISYMTVYAIPVGMEALGLFERPLSVLRYEVWLSTEIEKRVSEIRHYQVWSEYFENVRYLLYQNGLGGYDTLAFVGQAVESMKVARTIVTRFVGHEYLPTVADEKINEVTGERQLTISTGNRLTEAHRIYFEDMLLSEEFYVADGLDWLPLIPTFDGLSLANTAEWPIERSITFRYANSVTRFSRLPAIEKVSRPTSWRELATSCEIGPDGRRAGRRIVNMLVKYYIDTGDNVRPFTAKANTPGTDGYIAPWETADCDADTTPFLSAALSIASIKKKSDCGAGYEGTTWAITKPASAFGSELSQADADARALTAARALDTQANADLNGDCILRVPIPLSFQHYTFIGAGGLSYTPLVTVFVDGIEVISNVNVYDPLTYAAVGVSAGVHNIDVRFVFPFFAIIYCRVGIPSKGLVSGTIASNKTYRFANVVVNWGDPEIAIVATRL